MTPLNLSAPRYRATGEAGDKMNIRFAFNNLNITGMTFAWYMYDDEDGPLGDPIITKIEDDGIAITAGPTMPNIVAVSLDSADTLDLAPIADLPTKRWTELARIDLGFERTFAKGQLILS